MTARPCQNPTCRAAVEGSDRRLYCGKRCQQAHRNARRIPAEAKAPRTCARQFNGAALRSPRMSRPRRLFRAASLITT